MRKIKVINGPNLNLLSVREPSIYGTMTLGQLEDSVRQYASLLGVETDFFQSNSEGAIVDAIQACLGEWDGIIINPAAYTHYSYAILDALKAVALPAVEVHLSDVSQREPFRAVSVTAPACVGVIRGLGVQGYLRAVDVLVERG